MIIGKILVVYMKGYPKALSRVKSVLKKYKVNFSLKERTRVKQIDFKDVDLVIAIGGDGTFLRTAHFICDTPYIGVNADPKNKEGFFMRTKISEFSKNFERVLSEDYGVMDLTRLEAKVDGRKVKELALNEIYIGSKRPYSMSRFKLKYNGSFEMYKSSGLLVSTASGSYSWARSAGGREMPLSSKKIQLVVREPYKGRLMKAKTSKAVVCCKVEVIPQMEDCILVVDSKDREYPVRKRVIIEPGDSLKFLVFE